MRIFAFIEDCGLNPRSRVWKKADIFTLIVELHRALYREHLKLEPRNVGVHLSVFYDGVDASQGATDDIAQSAYYRAALQATNDRGSRIARGEIIAQQLQQVAGV